MFVTKIATVFCPLLRLISNGFCDSFTSSLTQPSKVQHYIKMHYEIDCSHVGSTPGVFIRQFCGLQTMRSPYNWLHDNDTYCHLIPCQTLLLQKLLLLQVFVYVWVQQSLTSHSTHYKSFRGQSSQPISFLLTAASTG